MTQPAPQLTIGQRLALALAQAKSGLLDPNQAPQPYGGVQANIPDVTTPQTQAIVQALSQGVQTAGEHMAAPPPDVPPPTPTPLPKSAYEAGRDIGDTFRGAAGIPGDIGQIAYDKLGRPVTNFFAGLTGGQPDTSKDFAAQAATGPTPEAQTPTAPAAPGQGPPEDQGFGAFLDKLLKANAADRGGRISATLGTGGGSTFKPTEPTAEEKQSRANLNNMIGELAKKSTLPEATFTERLTHVLTGLALGYNRAYFQTRNIGMSLGAGLAEGGAAGQRFVDQTSDEARRLQEADRQRMMQAATLQEGDLRAQQTERLQADQTRVAAAHVDAIREAAQMRMQAALQSGRSVDALRQALEIIQIHKAWREEQNYFPQNDVVIQTPAGPQKIGQLPLSERIPTIAAVNAPTRNPKLYKQAWDEAYQEAQKDGTIQTVGTGDALRKAVQDKAQQKLIAFYKLHPEALNVDAAPLFQNNP